MPNEYNKSLVKRARKMKKLKNCGGLGGISFTFTGEYVNIIGTGVP